MTIRGFDQVPWLRAKLGVLTIKGGLLFVEVYFLDIKNPHANSASLCASDSSKRSHFHKLVYNYLRMYTLVLDPAAGQRSLLFLPHVSTLRNFWPRVPQWKNYVINCKNTNHFFIHIKQKRGQSDINAECFILPFSKLNKCLTSFAHPVIHLPTCLPLYLPTVMANQQYPIIGPIQLVARTSFKPGLWYFTE